MTSKSVLLGAAALLVAGAGLASVVLKTGGDDVEPEPVAIAQANEVMKTIPQEPTQAQREFQSMAVPRNEIVECSAPRPPNHLSPKAYVRNSYAAILEIMAVQRWQATGSCECFLSEIAWDQVVSAAPDFERTDGVALRFDFPKLRAETDALVALQTQACSE